MKQQYTVNNLTGIEIRDVEKPVHYDLWINEDFRGVDNLGGYDLVLGNPPYNLAIESVEYGLDCLKPDGYLMALFRADFTGSQSRFSFWKNNKPCKVVYAADRPSFIDGGTDRYNYAFFLWQKGFTGQTDLEWIFVKKDFPLDSVCNIVLK